MKASRKSERSAAVAPSRREYMPPALETLGTWRAMNLQNITLDGYLGEWPPTGDFGDDDR